MSNETHDQNKSVDTPDTAPSRMRILLLGVVAYLLVACMAYIFLYGFDVEFTDPVTPPVVGVAPTVLVETVTPNLDATPTNFSPYPPRAYWHGGRTLITEDQMIQGNLLAANDASSIKGFIEKDAAIPALFVDRSVLENLSEDDRAFLQELHANGMIIVGLQSPHSLLTNALQLQTELADVDPSTIEDGEFLASIHYQTESGSQELVQTFNRLDTLLTLVAALN